MLKNRNVLLGVTGGIAAYKAADLVSRLIKEGAKVDVIMTEAAQKFVTPLTFQTMSQSKVHFEMFGLEEKMDVEHISLAKKADLILIAPATGNTIGKIAQGIADNLLTTIAMASKAPIVFAPAMNTNMYLNPIVQKNIEILKQLGHKFISPGSGRLACGDVGPGKMAEPLDIIEYLNIFLTKKDLEGTTIIVTAGPTVEQIDPVRFISNNSSGKMGYSIAKEAANRGAKVILISGPTKLKPPSNVELISIKSTEEMFKALESKFDFADVIIKAAAPSDFRVKNPSSHKIKKQENIDEFALELVKNPDIISHFGKIKGKQVLVGFAAETNNLTEYAKAKLTEKNLDMIVANDVSKPGAGFDVETNIATIIYKNGEEESFEMMTKDELAKIIIDRVHALI